MLLVKVGEVILLVVREEFIFVMTETNHIVTTPVFIQEFTTFFISNFSKFVFFLLYSQILQINFTE